MREFIFKFRNNQLPLNNRLSAYDNTVDPRCNFCRIIDNQSTTRDSFEHFFLTCRVTKSLLNNFSRKLEPAPDTNSEYFTKLYWFGSCDTDPHMEKFIILAMDLFRFVLWTFKCRKKVPNWPMFEREFNFLLVTTLDRNTSLKLGFMNLNMLANIYPALG